MLIFIFCHLFENVRLYLLASIFVLPEDGFIKIKQVYTLQVEKILKSMI